MSGRVKKRSKNKTPVTQSLEEAIKAHFANTEEQHDADANDEDEAPDNGMGIVETYSEYWPAKLKIGAKHPDPVVCTASLASVESADITYELKLPENVIRDGLLSALQLEAVACASQAHERRLSDIDNSRVGFLIGDGAGVGKGRTIAGIIYENHLQNRRKSLWISVSNDLKYDAQRDFNDIGADIVVHSLSKLHSNSRISSSANGKVTSGVLFCTYALLIGESKNIGKFNTRMAQIIDWCGEDFDGCIVFDESHKAKNLIPASSLQPTKTGKAVVNLQYSLPNARVVYSSATGASEPRNMAYMVRLGLWGVGTSFRTFQDFEKAVERRGVGAMEIVAMDMKLRGMYVARQLSFQGVTFHIKKVPLTAEFIQMYNASVALWSLALKSFQQAVHLMGVPSNTSKIIWGQFWGAHQRFFKYLSIAAKVDHVVKISKEAVECGKCVVIGLQSTGEARTLDELDKKDGELDDFISTAKAVFSSLVEKQFPALDRDVADDDENVSTVKVEEVLSSRRERKPVEKFKFPKPSTSRKRKMEKPANKKSQPPTHQLRWKRMRFDDSSDDDFTDYSVESDSEQEEKKIIAVKREGTKELSSSEADHHEMNESFESEFDPESDDTSDTAESESSEQSTPFECSDDDDSETETPTKRKRKLKVKMSKVQEHLQKQHKESNPKSSSKSGLKARSFKDDIIDSVREMKDELLKQVEELGERLPKNTLDDLINKLGGSNIVAEMTGRNGRVAGYSDGTVQYESRGEAGISLEMLNIKEKERFMSGEKFIAIISEAASSGISLQSDRRVANQRRRLHITLELPWAADRAIQQFGRTHRSNQVNGPEYVFLISELAGEQRFVATVARRLESLGALCHGDRRATQSRDLSEFNIDNRLGRKALARTLHAIAKMENPMIPPPANYVGDFFGDVHKALLDAGLDFHVVVHIVRFLNRSLGVQVHLQNHLFKYFSDTLHATIVQAKKEKKFDPGLLDCGSPEKITRISVTRFFHQHATGITPVELHTFRVDRGLSWTEALAMSKTLTKEHEGFYIENEVKSNIFKALLAIRLSDDDSLPANMMMFGIYKPHLGHLVNNNESLEYMRRTYRKVTAEKAEGPWNYQYERSLEFCNHAFYSGKCTTSKFTECDSGKRITDRAVLSGSVLGVWDRVERQLRGVLDDGTSTGTYIRMQVCRLRSNDGQPNTIGILIPKECVNDLSDELGKDAVSVDKIMLTDVKPDLTQMVKVEPKIDASIEIKSEKV